MKNMTGDGWSNPIVEAERRAELERRPVGHHNHNIRAAAHAALEVTRHAINTAAEHLGFVTGTHEAMVVPVDADPALIEAVDAIYIDQRRDAA